MLNKAILQGRLTKDPELQTTQGGAAYCRFTLASDRDFAKEDGSREADFVSCVAWRKTAEFITKYFHKGDMALISGRIQTGSYTDKDGAKRYTTDVVVDAVNFCGSKRDKPAQSDNAEHNYAELESMTQRFAEPQQYDDMRLVEVQNDDGDLPF